MAEAGTGAEDEGEEAEASAGEEVGVTSGEDNRTTPEIEGQEALAFRVCRRLPITGATNR